MRLILFMCFVTISLTVQTQTTECNKFELNQIGLKFKDSSYYSPNKEVWLIDTTRIDAADHILKKFDNCIKGMKIRKVRKLLGKENFFRKRNLTCTNCKYQIEYFLIELGPNGRPIEGVIPSSLYITFNKRRRAINAYIISY